MMSAQEALRTTYGDGWAAGCEDTLKLLLGETAHEAAPYRGPRPPELTEWAESALEKLTEARKPAA